MASKVGFTHGAIYRKAEIYLAAVNIELEEEDVYHGYVVRWANGVWAGQWAIANRIYALGVYDLQRGRTTLALAPDGQIQVGDADGFRWESIDVTGDCPSQGRPVTCMRRVGNSIFVAGMSRMVYRRLADGMWTQFDDGMRVPRSSLDIEGFLGIDGFSEDDLYAVGYHGQIWHFNGRGWRQVDSVTNLKLECVRCAEDGNVYIGGSKGMVLCGREDSWTILEQDLTEETFWSLEYAFGSVFFATAGAGLYRLSARKLTSIDTGWTPRPATRALHFNDGLLLSVGTHDVCTYDGDRWFRIDQPA
jgi:hypothetical protein